MDPWEYEPAKDQHLSPVERWRAYQRESGLASSLARWCWWSFLKLWLRVWHRLEVHGAEHLPQTPNFVLVANHASHLDTLVLGSSLRLNLRNYLFPLAAGDVFFDVPMVAAFSAGVVNALPIWRKSEGCGRAIKDLRQRLLDEPTIFVLFPEGTRTRDGAMASFKPGIGMLVAATPYPIIPCYIEGAFQALPAKARFPRPIKLRVNIGPPRTFDHLKNRRAGWEEIASTLEQDVRQLGGISNSSSPPVSQGNSPDECS